MKVAICDDQKEVLITIQDMLKEILSSEILSSEIFSSGNFLPGECSIAAFSEEKAFSEYVAGAHPDVAIIDILLGNEARGIGLAKQANIDSPETAVIFISGYNYYSEELYKTEHLYFLRKPLTAERLRAALRKAADKTKQRTITLNHRGGAIDINVGDIVMVESHGRKLSIYMADTDIIEHSAKLSEFAQMLHPVAFMRCHQSFLVNANHVVSVGKGKARLTGNRSAPISRRYAGSFKTMMLRKTGGLL